MRKPLIAGNWKMHGSMSQAKALVTDIQLAASRYPEIEIAVLPPYLYLSMITNLLTNSSVALGAQNLYLGAQGAYTGEISGPMLVDCGCRYVLVGHSERRTLFHENLALIAAKFQAAIAAGLKPILCVGETQEERESGKTETVIVEQLKSVIAVASISAFSQAVIAYEPVWAIGTGLTATPEQAQAVHELIRTEIARMDIDLAKTIRLLYGGSMKADNAASLLAMPDIDGGLIGGASLDANSFLKIGSAAVEVMKSKAA